MDNTSSATNHLVLQSSWGALRKQLKPVNKFPVDEHNPHAPYGKNTTADGGTDAVGLVPERRTSICFSQFVTKRVSRWNHCTLEQRSGTLQVHIRSFSHEVIVLMHRHHRSWLLRSPHERLPKIVVVLQMAPHHWCSIFQSEPRTERSSNAVVLMRGQERWTQLRTAQFTSFSSGEKVQHTSLRSSRYRHDFEVKQAMASVAWVVLSF